MSKKSEPTLEALASLAKRRGFLYQGSEIYGGDSTQGLPLEALKLWRYIFRYGIGSAAAHMQEV